MVAKQEQETDKKHERHKQQEEHVEFRRAIGKISLTKKCKEILIFNSSTTLNIFIFQKYIVLHQTVAHIILHAL